MTLPFSKTEQAEYFGRNATTFQAFLISEHRTELSMLFAQEKDNEIRAVIAVDMQLCRECLNEFKKVYRTSIAFAHQSLESPHPINLNNVNHRYPIPAKEFVGN